MAAVAYTVAANSTQFNFQDIFSKISKVYFNDGVLESTQLTQPVEWEMEMPILSDVTFNLGEVETQEVKLADGSIWTSKITKGDSDVSIRIPSVSERISSLFMTTGTSYSDGFTFAGGTYSGKGYKNDAKKTIGSLMFTDDAGSVCIIFPNMEMSGALTGGDGDNPAYFNVKITPKANQAGDALLIMKKQSV